MRATHTHAGQSEVALADRGVSGISREVGIGKRKVCKGSSARTAPLLSEADADTREEALDGGGRGRAAEVLARHHGKVGVEPLVLYSFSSHHSSAAHSPSLGICSTARYLSRPSPHLCALNCHVLMFCHVQRTHGWIHMDGHVRGCACTGEG